MSETQRDHAAAPLLVARMARLVRDESTLAGLREAREGLVEVADATDTVLHRLTEAYRLSRFEQDLVLLAGLVEEHEAVTRVMRTLHPTGEPALSVTAAAAVLGLDSGGRRHLRGALECGVLRDRGLVTGPESVPLPERGLRLTPGLWNVLTGVDHWPAEVSPRLLDELAWPSDLLGTVSESALLRAVSGPARLVVASGGTRVPATEVAGYVAGALDRQARPWAAFDPPEADGERATVVSAHAVARGLVPVLVGAPAGAPLREHPGAVVVCLSDVSGLTMDERPVVTLEWAPAGLGESAEMWNGLLPDLNGEAAQLAGLLRVDREGAARAVADARATAEVEETSLASGDVVRQVRRRTDVTLPGSVRLVRPRAGWDSLVLPAGQEQQLRSVIDRVRGQVRVLYDWGFSQARGTRGVRLLLSGPPGTGKTLAVEVLASALGLDLLVVDLASLVSKWLGETEKNIGEVFDAAERCQAVLFFDEADALFGRRTDGGDAQARWANLETAYLLSRIDRFDGLVALATNLRGHVDDAFVRRLDVVVELDEPDDDARDRLWRAHLPSGAPYSPDVDVPQLAGLYPVSGGLIRNAALAAAFAAAADGGVIDQRALVEAVRREYVKAGRSFPGAPRLAQHPSGKGH